MSRWSIVIGIGAGLLVGSTVLAWLQPVDAVVLEPLAEDVGRVIRVVIQYSPGFSDDTSGTGEIVADIYRQFLRAVGPQVQVIWVAENQQHLDDLKRRLGDAYPLGSRSVLTGKPITTWSKDRFTCLVPESKPGRTVLLAPARKAMPNPLRTNDQEVPWRLAAAFPSLLACRDGRMDFDGGDILATSRGVFAHPVILSKNDPTQAQSLRARLGSQLGELVWLGPAESDVPPHHVGMFLSIANGTAFVGDVRLAEKLTAGNEAEVSKACQSAGGPAHAEARAQLTRQLNNVAEQVRSMGLPVVRVPLMPSATARAWMSYNNGIVETREGRTRYYMPTFGLEVLDNAAADAFRRAGCEVIPIDCSRIWHLCGSLHCLVNVVERE